MEFFLFALLIENLIYNQRRNAFPRLASSSKDGTVRVWDASKTRHLCFALGSHTASVNVVRWGGEGIIYTGSSDRTIKLWDATDVSEFK